MCIHGKSSTVMTTTQEAPCTSWIYKRPTFTILSCHFNICNWCSDDQEQKMEAVSDCRPYCDMTLQCTYLPRKVHRHRQQNHLIHIVICNRFSTTASTNVYIFSETFSFMPFRLHNSLWMRQNCSIKVIWHCFRGAHYLYLQCLCVPSGVVSNWSPISTLPHPKDLRSLTMLLGETQLSHNLWKSYQNTESVNSNDTDDATQSSTYWFMINLRFMTAKPYYVRKTCILHLTHSITSYSYLTKYWDPWQKC